LILKSLNKQILKQLLILWMVILGKYIFGAQ